MRRARDGLGEVAALRAFWKTSTIAMSGRKRGV